jgi:hypothetical protein
VNQSTADWAKHVAEIRRIHTELQRTAPYRDDGLVPNPAATPARVEAAERRLGFELPPTYKQFLLRYDGWTRFFDGADMLAADQLGNAEHERAAHALLDATSNTFSYRRRRLLPFAVDSQLCSVFAFDLSSEGREKEVIGWVGELGVRASNFTDFLQLLAEVAAAELHSSQLDAAAMGQSRRASSAA